MVSVWNFQSVLSGLEVLTLVSSRAAIAVSVSLAIDSTALLPLARSMVMSTRVRSATM